MEAPRWRLISAHYLNVKELPDGTRVEWEHKETSKTTGKAVRKLYPVPVLLEPKDPADYNYPGEIIVAHEVEGCRNLPQDIIFIGEPTQEMEPLNAEAEAISNSLRAKWINPVETLPSTMSTGEQAFMDRMMAAFDKLNPKPAENTTVPKALYDELLARVAALEGKSSEARRV